MHSGLFFTGFWLGTFKFMFAHWLTYGAAMGLDYEPNMLEIFISVQLGCTAAMSLFYFSSGAMMRYAAKRRFQKEEYAIKMGKPMKMKKKFTRVNKGIVWIKRNIGIYGVTFAAPLFMSIPLGSVVCAKFYGTRRITYPLMVLFTLMYSSLMCLWIYLA